MAGARDERRIAPPMSIETFEIEASTADGDRAHVTLCVPERSRFFDGHFEGMPMLPGVAQVVAIAHREATRIFGALGTPHRMSRVKFQQTILPGDRLSLRLERVREATLVTIRFRLSRTTSEGPASSGTLAYDGATP